jgi:hypothetical protein
MARFSQADCSRDAYLRRRFAYWSVLTVWFRDTESELTRTSVLHWLFINATDFRITTVYPFVFALLPQLFQMQEILDNNELQRMAKNVTMTIAALPFPPRTVRPFMVELINLLKSSPSWRIRLDVLSVLQGASSGQLTEIALLLR